MDAPIELVREDWLNVPEVAERLDVGEETVRRWIRSGDLAALDLGGRRAGYRIRESDLEAFLQARYSTKKAAA
jgi:excisionase family DNA binding protein